MAYRSYREGLLFQPRDSEPGDGAAPLGILYHDSHRSLPYSLPSHACRPASVASSSSRCSQSEVFSRGSYSSSSAASSAPSDAVRPDLNQQTTGHPYQLTCEFPFTGCEVWFPPTGFEDWFSHSISHFFNTGPPPKSLCTICDDVEFRKKHNESLVDTWRRRLMHVEGHLRNHEHSPRPDFFVIKHLYKHRCISKGEYDHCTGFTERPFLQHLCPLSAETRAKSPLDRTTGQQYDLRKEKRDIRKQGKERKSRVYEPHPHYNS